MDLRMFLGNRLIDSIRISADQLNQPGRIDFLKMELQEKNEDIIDLSNEEPRFVIETVPSLMNRNTRQN